VNLCRSQQHFHDVLVGDLSLIGINRFSTKHLSSFRCSHHRYNFSHTVYLNILQNQYVVLIFMY
jgi:hypothetical protein